jgi:hypothetical protein
LVFQCEKIRTGKTSEDLKLRVQQYFLKKYKISLNDNEADLCLESLADLFLVFADEGKQPSSASYEVSAVVPVDSHFIGSS